jgi:curved DNA-binding protein CbpA
MSETGFVDYYALLHVATDADIQQIRAAFLRLAKEHHPDAGGSTEDMQQVTTAYRTLMHETSRKAYDLQHEFHSESPGTYSHSKSEARETDVDDLSDDEIDDFLDTIYREYQNKPKEKKSLFGKFKPGK